PPSRIERPKRCSVPACRLFWNPQLPLDPASATRSARSLPHGLLYERRPMKSIRRGLAGLFLPLFASLAGAQRTLFTVDGSAAQGFGGSIDIVGDLVGDGHGEFLIGTYLAKNGSLDDAGLARIFSG